MAKTKKATPSPADEKVEEKVYDGNFTYTDLNGKEVEVKYNLYVPLVDMCACINNIVDVVIDDSGYMPYFYDIALYANFFEAYTDFDTSVGFEKVNEILCNTDIKNILSKHVLLQPFNAIKDSVDKIIEYRKQHSIKSEIDDINSIQDIVPDIKRLLNKFETITDMVNVLIEKASANVNFDDPEIVGAAMSNLAKMTNVSEKDIIKALVEESGVTKNKGGRPKSNAKGKNKVTNKVVPFPEPELDGQVDIDGNVTEVEDK